MILSKTTKEACKVRVRVRGKEGALATGHERRVCKGIMKEKDEKREKAIDAGIGLSIICVVPVLSDGERKDSDNSCNCEPTDELDGGTVSFFSTFFFFMYF